MVSMRLGYPLFCLRGFSTDSRTRLHSLGIVVAQNRPNAARSG
jgi:hypothetical protein